IIQVLLRGLQLLWTLLLTALVGNVIASNVAAAASASALVNFTMFVVVVAWLVSLYGLAAGVVDSVSSRFASPAAVFTVDAVAAGIFLITAIALAAKLGVVNCGDLQPGSKPGDWIGYGSFDDAKRCRELQASTVFMWFLF
ncbi:marvel domain-containing protein, partial [Lasiosphaeria miniovina]